MLICRIISPDRVDEYEGLDRVTLPATKGQLQIWLGHAEAFIGLRSGGIVLYKEGAETKRISIESGECHVANDLLIIII